MLTDNKCERFSDSISPVRMPRSSDEVRQLLECMRSDIILYLDSLKCSDDFVSHFRKSILPRLEQSTLLEKFTQEIDSHASAELAKIAFVASNLGKILERTKEDVQWWLVKYSKNARLQRGENKCPRLDDLIDAMRIAYSDFAHLSVLLPQMFLALEFSCKMLCALGCYRFSLRVTKSEVIQHLDVWKQLKELGTKNGINCATCVATETCSFKIDFKALARIYAYSMKIRQIADYTTKLVSMDIFKSGLVNPPFVYFSGLTQIVESNLSLAKKCFPRTRFHVIASRLPFSKKGRKQLYAPFSWDETELKRLAKEHPKDGLTWYLLGKLYFKRNDTFNAIECMERAKKLTPKNPDVWFSLAMLYDNVAGTQRDESKSLKHLQKAKELNPKDVDVLFLVGAVSLARGDALQAIRCFESIKTLANDAYGIARANVVLYEAYTSRGDKNKARECLQDFPSNPYLADFQRIFRAFLKTRSQLQGRSKKS